MNEIISNFETDLNSHYVNEATLKVCFQHCSSVAFITIGSLYFVKQNNSQTI